MNIPCGHNFSSACAGDHCGARWWGTCDLCGLLFAEHPPNSSWCYERSYDTRKAGLAAPEGLPHPPFAQIMRSEDSAG
jgi:hypothetical protein